MIRKYTYKEVEFKIQKYWEKTKSFLTSINLEKKKYYCLSMFPYPSGNLHMGHVRNYTIGDVISRYKRMSGLNVLNPMGWDAFGLPAENAAIKKNTHPAIWTYKNIINMKQQLSRLGFSYDWDKEITTCDKKYYKWSQWLFICLLKKQIIYKHKSIVNWDPVDKTVLANEQIVNGKGWRSGAQIQQRRITQWFLKTSNYVEELFNELTDLDNTLDFFTISTNIETDKQVFFETSSQDSSYLKGLLEDQNIKGIFLSVANYWNKYEKNYWTTDDNWIDSSTKELKVFAIGVSDEVCE